MNVTTSDDVSQRQRIIVAICTHQRNDSLRRLLKAVARNAEHLGARADVGVVLVDDNVDGRAAEVAAEFSTTFGAGIEYRHAGTGNISVARNMALEVVRESADWIAMTDDDCEPVDTWLSTYCDLQRELGSTALTGPCRLEPPVGAPNWLTDEPFYEVGQFRFPNRTEMSVAATNNSFVSASFLRNNPDLWFAPQLGVVGGEDMVFFRQAVCAGLRIHFASDALVIGHEDSRRATFGHQLRSHFWMGNTEFVTNSFMEEAHRFRWLLRSAKLACSAVFRPIRRIAALQRPQFRYALALLARAAGVFVAVFGSRLSHHQTGGV